MKKLETDLNKWNSPRLSLKELKNCFIFVWLKFYLTKMPEAYLVS